MNTIDKLTSVLCDPSGKCCIAGSDADRAIIDGALRELLAQQPVVAPEWVGLTDDEIKGIIGPWGGAPIKGYTRTLFDQIEAKLKEKNTL